METKAMKLGRTLSWVAVLALLAACGSDPEPGNAATAAATPAPAPAKPAAPAKEDPTAQMARAVGNGKPGAAVDIKYEFSARPELGKPVELQVALIPGAGVDAMDVTFTGMDGITLAGALTASFGTVKAGEPYKHNLSVLPDRNGVFYITVSVNTQLGGAQLGKTFSIPFVVGAAPVQQKPAPAKDASGQPVEPMPAQETTNK
jgi:hypothetical protein